MPATELPTEILVLALAVVLLIVQIFIQASGRQGQGPEYLAGPRDEQKPLPSVFAGRAERALRNMLETFPAFAAVALALAVTGRTGGIGALGAWVYLAARVVYLPLYLAGIPMLRSLVWMVSLAGIAMMLWALVF